jgi:hypothetical protein
VRRVAARAALLGLLGCPVERAWYVDRIEGGKTVLVSLDGESRVVSTQGLPPDAGEGSWFRGDRRDPAAERTAQERVTGHRRALAAADDGRAIRLEP